MENYYNVLSDDCDGDSPSLIQKKKPAKISERLAQKFLLDDNYHRWEEREPRAVLSAIFKGYLSGDRDAKHFLFDIFPVIMNDYEKVCMFIRDEDTGLLCHIFNAKMDSKSAADYYIHLKKFGDIPARYFFDNKADRIFHCKRSRSLSCSCENCTWITEFVGRLAGQNHLGKSWIKDVLGLAIFFGCQAIALRLIRKSEGLNEHEFFVLLNEAQDPVIFKELFMKAGTDEIYRDFIGYIDSSDDVNEIDYKGRYSLCFWEPSPFDEIFIEGRDLKEKFFEMTPKLRVKDFMIVHDRIDMRYTYREFKAAIEQGNVNLAEFFIRNHWPKSVNDESQLIDLIKMGLSVTSKLPLNLKFKLAANMTKNMKLTKNAVIRSDEFRAFCRGTVKPQELFKEIEGWLRNESD